MNHLRRLRRPFFTMAFVVAALAFSAADAFATHFRYGSISWSVPNPATPNVIRIRFDAAWRRSFPWDRVSPPGTISNPPVGTVVTSESSVRPGNYVIRIFNAADAVVQTIPLNLTVTGADATQDIITTSFEINANPLPNGTYRVQFDDCCRLSSLVGVNADDPFFVTAGVTLSVPANRQPVAATLPIISVQHNIAAASFAIPGFDPDGDPLTYSIPTTAQSGLNQIVPPGLSINPITGVVTWDTRAPTVLNGLYALQFRVADNRGAYTSVDVLLRPVSAVGQPPTVRINGIAANQVFNVVRQTALTFTVNGTDPELAPVTMQSSPLPIGAAMTPSLPTSAPNGVVNSTFNWTPSATQIGTFAINYAVTDGSGQQANRTATINVTNRPPTVTCTASGGTIEATGPTGAPFSLTAALADPDNDQLTYRLFIDGALETTLTNQAPPISIPLSTEVPLGDHSYQVRVTDGFTEVNCAGNFSIVDTTAPTLFLPSDATLDGSGPGGAVHTYEVSATDTVDTAVTVSCLPPSGSPFPYGQTAVTCTATDDSGNGATGTFNVTVNDPTGPIVTYAIAGTGGDDNWYTSDVTVTWTVSDPDSGIASTSGCDPQLVNTDTNGIGFTCTATNNTGVPTEATTSSIKRDATAPTISHAVASIVAEATSSAGAAVNYDAPTVADNLSGVSGTTCTHASGATYGLGDTTVTCTVTDNAGNSSGADLVITVVDTTPPSINALGGATFEATSPAGAAIAYATPDATDIADPSVTVVCDPLSGTIAGFTPVTVTCTATDDAGNQSSTSAEFAAVDSTPPAFGPLPDLSLPGTDPGGLAVSWTATATDIVSGDVVVTCDPASGSTFGYQQTTVTCSATDGAGNPATDTFIVEITDATPPIITVTINGPLGMNDWYTGDVTVDWTVTDAQSPITSVTGCDDVTVNLDGTVTFTCEATSAGGTATESRTVKRDATGPVLSLPANFTVPATSTAGATVDYTAGASDATSGFVSFSCAPPPGSLFAIGNATVDCEAADAAGNRSSGSFVVTVSDTIPPVINDLSPSAGSLWPPNHQMVPITISVSATDNLGPAPVCSVTGVTSDEPLNGTGDGDTDIDWALTGGLTLELRSERAGGGDGRIYTVGIQCVDGAGNTATSSTMVSVAHSR